ATPAKHVPVCVAREAASWGSVSVLAKDKVSLFSDEVVLAEDEPVFLKSNVNLPEDKAVFAKREAIPLKDEAVFLKHKADFRSLFLCNQSKKIALGTSKP